MYRFVLGFPEISDTMATAAPRPLPEEGDTYPKRHI